MKCTGKFAATAALLALLLPEIGRAQTSSVDLSGRLAATRVTAQAIHQTYEEDSLSISELSMPVSISVPLSNGLSLGLETSYASVSGDDIESISGVTDTRLMLNLVRAFGSASVVVSLGANLPTGKQDLTIEEFTTLFLLAQNAFDFSVPGFGHGLSISPSIALALPVNPNVVMGLGASYQHRGGYQPVDFLQEEYQPGNEFLLTGGLDFRVNPSTSISLDATFARYQADRIGDVDVYEAGGKTTLTAMVRQVRGFNEWRLVALYRSRAKSNELAGAELVTQDKRTIPNQLLLRGSYAARLSPSLTTVLLAEGRFFDETEIYPGRNVFDLGVLPQLRLGENAVLLTRFIYTLGTITGFEAGGGLSISL